MQIRKTHHKYYDTVAMYELGFVNLRDITSRESSMFFFTFLFSALVALITNGRYHVGL